MTKKINYILLVDQSVPKQKAYFSKISIFYGLFSKRKKAPIWDLFFAAQFLWPQHFLHGIMDEYMDQFIHSIIKQH